MQFQRHTHVKLILQLLKYIAQIFYDVCNQTFVKNFHIHSPVQPFQIVQMVDEKIVLGIILGNDLREPV